MVHRFALNNAAINIGAHECFQISGFVMSCHGHDNGNRIIQCFIIRYI